MKNDHIIALPDDILNNIKDKKEKTLFISTIARALAIFKIDEVVIFKSPFISKSHRKRDRKMLKMVLEYLETPQYLRKKLYPLSHNLKFVGACPPLATPHHQTNKNLRDGEIREGLIYLRNKKIIGNVGGKRPINIINPPNRSFSDGFGLRVPVRIIKDKKDHWIGKLIEPQEAKKYKYMGYRVRMTDATLGQYLENRRKTVIITSAKGKPIEHIDFKATKSAIQNKPLLIVFGSQNYGLLDFLKHEQKSFSDAADIIVNTWKDSGTRTIRLEEALFISLARILPKLQD